MPLLPERAVFLSYASQDAAAARRICEALRAAGVGVWFDQSELTGGDAWDAKIRKQIAECALFVPVISAVTQARLEGYFRIEWKLAAHRTHAMAEEKAFLLPVVIDATRDAEAKVPAEFKTVQWTRLPNGETPAAFVSRVRTLMGEDSNAGMGHRTPPASGTSTDPTKLGHSALQPNRTATRRWFAPVIIAVVALALWQPWKSKTLPTRTAPQEKTAQATAAAEKSVAVLAFKNLSGDPAREFFSDGLSDAVTDVLGRVPGLKVVSSASAFSFKGKPVPIPEIARQLGVTHLVEGTVLQEGQTVRITAKLIKADGFQVWVSEKLDRELKNIFALHDEVAGLIAKNLSLKLGASSAPSRAAVNPQAFELYLQARQAWNLRTLEGYDLAESALTRALALEPHFARAHAALADVWVGRVYFALRASEAEDQPDTTAHERIRTKIIEALTLDPDSAEAHAALGNLLNLDGKNSEAESALRRSVALNPNYAPARQWLSMVLVNRAQLDEALEHSKLATELDPLSPRIWLNYGSALRYAGRPADGIIAFDRALTLQPNFYLALRGMSHALVELGRFREAVAMVKRLSSEDVRTAGSQLFVFARAGLKAEAEALLAEPRSHAYNSSQRPLSLLALGRTEEALALMTPKWINFFRASSYLWDTIFDPVRNDPRWVKLMADAGLTEAHTRAQAWRKAHPPEKPATK